VEGGYFLVVSLLYLLFRRGLAVAALRLRSREFKELEAVSRTPVDLHVLRVWRRWIRRVRNLVGFAGDLDPVEVVRHRHDEAFVVPVGDRVPAPRPARDLEWRRREVLLKLGAEGGGCRIASAEFAPWPARVVREHFPAVRFERSQRAFLTAVSLPAA